MGCIGFMEVTSNGVISNPNQEQRRNLQSVIWLVVVGKARGEKVKEKVTHNAQWIARKIQNGIRRQILSGQ